MIGWTTQFKGKKFSLDYRNLEEMMLERGLEVDHSTINRWVLDYGPELDRRCRLHLKSSNDSWRVDETYVKVKYLNNIVEQDRRGVKHLINPGMNFGSFNSARKTIKGYEAMNTIRKRQINYVDKGDLMG